VGFPGVSPPLVIRSPTAQYNVDHTGVRCEQGMAPPSAPSAVSLAPLSHYADGA